MESPDIEGVEYQRGTLAGVELGEYLLEKCKRTCAYCHTQNVPLEKDHILARSKGGSDRVSNLTLACRPCKPDQGRAGRAHLPGPAAGTAQAHPVHRQGAAARRGRGQLDALGPAQCLEGPRPSSRDRLGRAHKVQPHAPGDPEDPCFGCCVCWPGRRRSPASSANLDGQMHGPRSAPAHQGERLRLSPRLPHASQERSWVPHGRHGQGQCPGKLQASRRVCRTCTPPTPPSPR